jgi:hypothetical protein
MHDDQESGPRCQPSGKRGEGPATWVDHIRPRLAGLNLPPDRELEIIEELSQHLDDTYHDAIASGASSDKAKARALAAFKGNEVLARHLKPLRIANTSPALVSGAPVGSGLAALGANLRFGLRILWRSSAWWATSARTA